MVEVTKVNSGGYYEDAHNHSRLVMVDNWIMMSNSAGVIPETGKFSDDPVEQATQLISNIKHALNHVGSDLSDIVRMVITIPNREDIMPVQGYVGASMRGIDPVMTLICSPLGSDNYKVEIEVTAYKGAGQGNIARTRSGLFGK